MLLYNIEVGGGTSTLEIYIYMLVFNLNYLPRSMMGDATSYFLLGFHLTLLQHFGTHVKIYCLERINKCAFLLFVCLSFLTPLESLVSQKSHSTSGSAFSLTPSLSTMASYFPCLCPYAPSLSLPLWTGPKLHWKV